MNFQFEMQDFGSTSTTFDVVVDGRTVGFLEEKEIKDWGGDKGWIMVWRLFAFDWKKLGEFSTFEEAKENINVLEEYLSTNQEWLDPQFKDKSLAKNVYIISNVLFECTAGMIAIVAKNLEECRDLFVEEFKGHYTHQFDKAILNKNYCTIPIDSESNQPSRIIEYVYGNG